MAARDALGLVDDGRLGLELGPGGIEVIGGHERAVAEKLGEGRLPAQTPLEAGRDQRTKGPTLGAGELWLGLSGQDGSPSWV